MQYVIEVPDRLVAGLNRVVGRYNAGTGRDFDVPTWLRVHVLELAVQDELVAEHTRLTQQAQEDVAAAVEALRDRLTAPLPASGGDDAEVTP
jgi:hypothetical protein